MTKRFLFFCICILNYTFAYNQTSNHFKQDTTDSETVMFRLDSVIDYLYNPTTLACDQKKSKKSYYYNDAFLDTMVLTHIWDLELNQWRLVLKELSNYNNQNLLQSHEEHLISKSGNKVEYRYNSSGKTHSITESKWLFSEEQWHLTCTLGN